MKILIDTHIFLWASGKTARLSPETLDLLGNPETQKFLSVASAWEISIKYGKGMLPLPEHPRTFIPLTLADSDVTPIPVTLRDAIGVTDLPRYHGDPFDRLLIAQARLNGMYLLTDDRVFERYDVDLINLR
ncbi:MAG: type II toxin-antitoxin system VapC family toxin [Pyrinomonadaceae bacterium]|nr:type II toxin-antitoxin system VapC family toxin [Pyrinomonadaceae bacterium]